MFELVSSRYEHASMIVTSAVVFILTAGLWCQLNGRPGRAWALIRQGAQCAQSAGINVRRYTLGAVAVSCFITGVAGALLAEQLHTEIASSFVPEASISIFAVALLGGAYSTGGYVIGGLLSQLIPAIINQLGASDNVGLVIFGIGLLATLLATPGGLAGSLRQLRILLSSQVAATREHRPREARADA